MFSPPSRQPVFLGESYKFSPNPLHKTSFPAYVPRTVPTHEKHIERVPYPYQNMRFDHLRTFYIPHTKLDHPYAKHLKIDPFRQEHETTEVEHLGIKAEMLTGSRPNEAKPEMGLGEKEGVKEFAIKNLQEAKGTENTLTRHRDEAVYENISTLPFEEQYKKFLNEKQENTSINHHNKKIESTIKEIENADLSTGAKDALKKIHEGRKRADNPITNRKKTVVKPIVAPLPPAPPATTAVPPAPPATTATLPVPTTPPPVPLSNKKKPRTKKMEPFVEAKVNDIENDVGVEVSGGIVSDLVYLQTELKTLKGTDDLPADVKQKAVQMHLLKSNTKMKVKGFQEMLNRNIKKLRRK